VLISSGVSCRIVQSRSDSAAEIDLNYCASEFYSDSTLHISKLSVYTLDAILSNDSLRIVDED
jgi:hypothetical protein